MPMVEDFFDVRWSPRLFRDQMRCTANQMRIGAGLAHTQRPTDRALCQRGASAEAFFEVRRRLGRFRGSAFSTGAQLQPAVSESRSRRQGHTDPEITNSASRWRCQP